MSDGPTYRLRIQRNLKRADTLRVQMREARPLASSKNAFVRFWAKWNLFWLHLGLEGALKRADRAKRRLAGMVI
ncbi:MAG: hypothetical protein KJZ75_11550 [Hyphomonadaceae bacterium]|nr:hypothetical protein [Hyphomonadaceae bacterium]